MSGPIDRTRRIGPGHPVLPVRPLRKDRPPAGRERRDEPADQSEPEPAPSEPQPTIDEYI